MFECFTQYSIYFTLMSSSLRSRERGPRIPSGTDVFWSWGVLWAQVGSFFALFSHFWRLLSILWSIFAPSGVRRRFFKVFGGFLVDFGRIWERFLDDFSPYLRKLRFYEKSRFALEKPILFKGRGSKNLPKIDEKSIEKQRELEI